MDILTEIVAWLRQNSIIPVFAMFCVIVGWTFWPSHKGPIEKCGQIPFDDDL